MRAFALAAVIGVGMTFTGVAAANPYSDANISFATPSGWNVERLGADSSVGVLSFNASNDCFFFGIPNPNTATSSAEAARNSTNPMSQSEWITAASAAQMRRDFFPSGATVVSSSVDTSGFWPVQRAQLQGSKTVQAAIQVRPGYELRAFCAGSANFDQIFSSVAHPNDATWRTQAESASGDRAARQAAQEAAAAQQAQQTAQPQQSEADGVNDGVSRSSRDPRARRRGN